MISNIATRLNKAIAAYRRKTALDVRCIYLGRTQMRELIALANTHDCFPVKPTHEGKHRMEYWGALVFEVDDDDHLNVS